MSTTGSFTALQETPSAEGIEMLCATLAPGAKAANPRPLGGGIRCGIHALDLRKLNGKIQTIVLKRFSLEFLAENPQAFDAERRALDIVAGTSVPTPRLVWVDREGVAFGVPALAMTLLPGITLTRAMADFDPLHTTWTRSIARALAQIHATPPVPGDRDLLLPGDSAAAWNGIADTLVDEERERRAALLPRGDVVAEMVARPPSLPSPRPDTLLHGDFHPSNLLWDRGTLSGVLDWAEARIGAREYDLAHMRWELALRLGPETADRFLKEYQSISGYVPAEMHLWDLLWIWRQADGLGIWVWFFELEGQVISLDALQRRRDLWLNHVLAGQDFAIYFQKV